MARSESAQWGNRSPLRTHGSRLAGLLRAVVGTPLRLDDAAPPLKDLPWLRRLDGESLRTFLDEYAAAYQSALDDGMVDALDTLLKEWEATAEALDDPELNRLLHEPELPTKDRVPLDYPA